MTTLDKDLYRYAYQLHRQWHEAERKARLRSADTPSAQQGWQQYVALWEFGWQLKLKPSQGQRQQKLAALMRYYNRVEKLETWRAIRGRTA